MLAMATNKFQRYEAVVKLDNEAVVPYHNINTGLKKFHRFVISKFNQKFIKYTVRRIETKEIIGTFYNAKITQYKAVRVYLPKQRNSKDTGFFVRFPFERYQALINRNIFFSDKIRLTFMFSIGGYGNCYTLTFWSKDIEVKIIKLLWFWVKLQYFLK